MQLETAEASVWNLWPDLLGQHKGFLEQGLARSIGLDARQGSARKTMQACSLRCRYIPMSNQLVKKYSLDMVQPEGTISCPNLTKSERLIVPYTLGNEVGYFSLHDKFLPNQAAKRCLSAAWLVQIRPIPFWTKSSPPKEDGIHNEERHLSGIWLDQRLESFKEKPISHFRWCRRTSKREDTPYMNPPKGALRNGKKFS